MSSSNSKPANKAREPIRRLNNGDLLLTDPSQLRNLRVSPNIGNILSSFNAEIDICMQPGGTIVNLRDMGTKEHLGTYSLVSDLLSFRSAMIRLGKRCVNDYAKSRLAAELQPLIAGLEKEFPPGPIDSSVATLRVLLNDAERLVRLYESLDINRREDPEGVKTTFKPIIERMILAIYTCVLTTVNNAHEQSPIEDFLFELAVPHLLYKRLVKANPLGIDQMAEDYFFGSDPSRSIVFTIGELRNMKMLRMNRDLLIHATLPIEVFTNEDFIKSILEIPDFSFDSASELAEKIKAMAIPIVPFTMTLEKAIDNKFAKATNVPGMAGFENPADPTMRLRNLIAGYVRFGWVQPQTTGLTRSLFNLVIDKFDKISWDREECVTCKPREQVRNLLIEDEKDPMFASMNDYYLGVLNLVSLPGKSNIVRKIFSYIFEEARMPEGFVKNRKFYDTIGNLPNPLWSSDYNKFIGFQSTDGLDPSSQEHARAVATNTRIKKELEDWKKFQFTDTVSRFQRAIKIRSSQKKAPKDSKLKSILFAGGLDFDEILSRAQIPNQNNAARSGARAKPWSELLNEELKAMELAKLEEPIKRFLGSYPDKLKLAAVKFCIGQVEAYVYEQKPEDESDNDSEADAS